VDIVGPLRPAALAGSRPVPVLLCVAGCFGQLAIFTHTPAYVAAGPRWCAIRDPRATTRPVRRSVCAAQAAI